MPRNLKRRVKALRDLFERGPIDHRLSHEKIMVAVNAREAAIRKIRKELAGVWIAIADGPPPNLMHVLVRMSDERRRNATKLRVGYWMNGEWAPSEIRNSKWPVTHWMTIPLLSDLDNARH